MPPIWKNTRLMKFLPYDSIREAEAAIRESMRMWQSRTPHHLEFAVCLNGTHIGSVTMYLTQPGEADLGWVLDKHYWGRGLAREAVEAVMEYGRDHWGIRRFFAVCDSENEPSYRLMERLGMRRVPGAGVRKNRSSDEERKQLTYEKWL